MKTCKPVLVGLGLLSVLAFTGCATAPVAPSDKLKATLVEDVPPPPEMELTPFWDYETEDTIRLYLYGSSSCPPVVEAVTLEGNSLEVHLHDYAGQACTEDWGGPHVWEVFPVTDDVNEIILLVDGENQQELPKRDVK